MNPEHKEKTFITTLRITKELHQRVKVRCAQLGITVTEWVKDLILKSLEEK